MCREIATVEGPTVQSLRAFGVLAGLGVGKGRGLVKRSKSPLNRDTLHSHMALWDSNYGSSHPSLSKTQPTFLSVLSKPITASEAYEDEEVIVTMEWLWTSRGRTAVRHPGHPPEPVTVAVIQPGEWQEHFLRIPSAQ